ncbi:MAG: hypothetical protein FWF21_03710 [Micrococcales bacterium]|nr:hypothetical protein [Micrococcales bacterium]
MNNFWRGSWNEQVIVAEAKRVKGLRRNTDVPMIMWYAEIHQQPQKWPRDLRHETPHGDSTQLVDFSGRRVQGAIDQVSEL